MRFMRNGRARVGDGEFWRIDDTLRMSAADFSMLAFMKHPFALIDGAVPVDEIDRLVAAWNASWIAGQVP